MTADRRAALVEKVAMAIAKAEIEYFGPRSSLVQCMAWANEPDCYRNAATAAIALIRAEVLEEVASPAFLRPLVEEQSRGEWDEKTIDEDVIMYSGAIRALKGKS